MNGLIRAGKVGMLLAADVSSLPLNSAVGPLARAANESPTTKLLGAEGGERLDAGEAGKASGADPWMATMGELDRATDGAGQAAVAG